ncbi:MAG TPA: carboxypeptidase-like regulatory domain-containing protein, partial [Luteitalea sp.]|nr:carboxypeptidase-like regulatory domain-containing protein [Luteitalea sp.]
MERPGWVRLLSPARWRTSCLLLLWLLGTTGAGAQTVDTGVLGTVTDGSGALIPGAAVTVTNQATGVKGNIVSGSDGAFEVRYLTPGEYVMDVTLDGFKTERRTFQLRGSQLIRVDVQMSVGGQQETVEVVAAGQLIETQSGVTGNTVSARTITNLPLSGRNFTSLGNLTAGVVASGTQFRASGARGMYQQVSFDGVSALNNRGNNLFMYPSVDAVEEFKVQATNYTAEYGGHAGANVTLQLKSGTNALRGTVFEFYRNDALDARNYFSPAPNPKPQLERHQYGGVIGGPIKRGRTFFMASYEKTDDVREVVAQANVIPDAFKRGDFSS